MAHTLENTDGLGFFETVLTVVPRPSYFFPKSFIHKVI